MKNDFIFRDKNMPYIYFKFIHFSDSEMAISTPCASTSDCSNDAEQPEHDYIKMFVGQIPRAMNEQDLMDMFGEFGRVYQLNLLRDKFTGVSKGKVLGLSKRISSYNGYTVCLYLTSSDLLK